LKNQKCTIKTSTRVRRFNICPQTRSDRSNGFVLTHFTPDLTISEEIVRAFNYIIEKGQAFYWGTSEWSAEEIMEASKIATQLGLIGPTMEQPE
jgi:aryl-alcohol dehydrogenase-like predicted oxidoreductase